jgi:hypothetical protein
MPAQIKRMKAKETPATSIPPSEWGSFLDRFNARYHGWLVQLETYDVVTREKVVSQEMPLESIELDLEDKKNPRINVTVHDGNKVIKHILFRPWRLVSLSSDRDQEQSLQVDTVNTETVVRFRAPVPSAAA